MSTESKRPSSLLKKAKSPISGETIKSVRFESYTTSRQFYSDDAPEIFTTKKEIISSTKKENSGSVYKSPNANDKKSPNTEKTENKKYALKISEIIAFICCLPFLIYLSFVNLFYPCVKHVTIKSIQCCRNYGNKKQKINPICDINNMFIDTNFSPNNDSLNVKQLNTDNVVWLSVTDIYANEKVKFNIENINIENIINGYKTKKEWLVNNKWLLGVIVSLCEYPHLIKKLFLSNSTHDKNNTHRFKLFDGRAQKWILLKIDDMIPCNIYTKKPLFNYPKNSNEIWFILLEKCIAKFVGNYGNLSDGNFGWALQLLSGRKVSIFINTAEQRDSWTEGYIKYNQTLAQKKVIDTLHVNVTNVNENKLKSCPCQQYKMHFEDNAKNYFSTKRLWIILNEAQTNGGLIIATKYNEDKIGNNIELNECEIPNQNCGILLSDHSYNILQIKEIQCFKLIQINNPWNTFKWNGKWSNNHSIWNEYPLIFDTLKPDFNQTNKFWVELNEFTLLFNVIYVCHKVKRISYKKNDIVLNINQDTDIYDTSAICCNKCFHFWCKCVSCKIMYPKIYNKMSKWRKQQIKSKYLP